MKLNSANVAIYVFIVIVIVMIALALYGYLSGRWETNQ